MKLGYSIVVSGHTGTGKTTSVKSTLKKIKNNSMYIFDVNAEYLEFNNKAKNAHDFDVFLDLVEDVKNSVIVFEESTIFLSKSSNLKKIRSLLVRKRHNKNVVIFNFHSVRSVSNFIIDLSDFYILHYTTDKPEYINHHFKDSPEMISAYNYVQRGQKVNRFIKKIIPLK